MKGLKPLTEYETKLYQYGGDYRNTNGLLTLNDGATVKVGFLSLQKSIKIIENFSTFRSLNQLMLKIRLQILQLKSVQKKEKLQ